MPDSSDPSRTPRARWAGDRPRLDRNAMLLLCALDAVACHRDRRLPIGGVDASSLDASPNRGVRPTISASMDATARASALMDAAIDTPSSVDARVDVQLPDTGMLAAQNTIIVGGSAGIQEIGADGTVRRRLSATPALLARYVPGGRAIVFLSPAHGDMRWLDLRTRVERTVIFLPTLPGSECAGAWDGVVDPIPAVTAFRVYSSGEFACVRMIGGVGAGVIDLDVDLRPNAPEDSTVRNESCSGEPDPSGDCTDPFAGPAFVSNVNVGQPAGPGWLLGERGVLTRPDGAMDGGTATTDGGFGETLPLLGVHIEGHTASGQFQVFSSDRERRDPSSRDIYVFDRRNGGVYPVAAGPWPGALTAADLRARHPQQITAALSRDEPVAWFAGGDVFVVDDLLVVPGVRVVVLPGDLAR